MGTAQEGADGRVDGNTHVCSSAWRRRCVVHAPTTGNTLDPPLPARLLQPAGFLPLPAKPGRERQDGTPGHGHSARQAGQWTSRRLVPREPRAMSSTLSPDLGLRCMQAFTQVVPASLCVFYRIDEDCRAHDFQLLRMPAGMHRDYLRHYRDYDPLQPRLPGQRFAGSAAAPGHRPPAREGQRAVPGLPATPRDLRRGRGTGACAAASGGGPVVTARRPPRGLLRPGAATVARPAWPDGAGGAGMRHASGQRRAPARRRGNGRSPCCCVTASATNAWRSASDSACRR